MFADKPGQKHDFTMRTPPIKLEYMNDRTNWLAETTRADQIITRRSPFDNDAAIVDGADVFIQNHDSILGLGFDTSPFGQ